MEDVKNWLANPESYTDGLSLAETYIRNRNLLKYLKRTVDPKRLIYELQKLVPIATAIANEIEPNVFRERFEYDKLPEELKPYYDKAAQSYQDARKWHYAMKAANSNDKRKEYRSKTLAAIGERNEGWAVLDHWKKTGKLLVAEQNSKSLQALASSFSREMSKLSKSPEDETLKSQVVELAIEMRKQGRVFSPKTITKLAEYNVILPNA